MANRTCSVGGCRGDVYCKSMCVRHYTRAHRGWPLEPNRRTECNQCGAELPPSTGRPGPPRLYCSKSCQWRASYIRTQRQQGKDRRDAARASLVKACPECSAMFTPARTTAQVYCSLRCQRRALADSKTRICSEPGCDRPHRAKGLCNMHYKAKLRSEGRIKTPAWDERRRANWQKRYALSRGAEDAESFDYREIFDRDNWTCGICSEPVDPDLSWPDPLSVSLDHIVPVSRGGKHARDNAQCSHLGCNVRKGARVAV